jgi:hypothetical protein
MYICRQLEVQRGRSNKLTSAIPTSTPVKETLREQQAIGLLAANDNCTVCGEISREKELW